jgi:hypothetical protein
VVVQQNGARLLVAVSQIRAGPCAALGTIIPIRCSYSIVCLLLLDQNHIQADLVVTP